MTLTPTARHDHSCQYDFTAGALDFTFQVPRGDEGILSFVPPPVLFGMGNHCVGDALNGPMTVRPR
jgi:hypothetical protein